MERGHSCWSCQHCGESERGSQGRPKRVKCEITKRMGKLSRGYYCQHFKYMQRSGELGDDGIPIKNRQPLDYRTERQWESEGRRIREGETGVIMHSSRLSLKVYEYYLIEQTEVIDNGENAEG